MSDILARLDFGNEAADDVDPEELAHYFVEQAAFSKFLDSRHKLLVATARKGVGKSALLQWVAHKIGTTDQNALVIRCRGADLVRSKFNLSSQLVTPNDYIRDWMVRLCALVNRQLALTLNLALSDDQITLIETAELEGYKARNLVGCLLDRLQSLFDRGRITKLGVKDELEVLRRVKNRRVWIVIDDLDATYQNTPAEQISLATFFSACRYLTQDLRDVFFRVTMRTDVWALLRRYDEALDKVDQYVSEILWYQKDFLDLLALRIKSGLGSVALPKSSGRATSEEAKERLLETVFVPKMQWGDKMVETY